MKKSKDERYAAAVERNLRAAETYKSGEFQGVPLLTVKRILGIRADDAAHDERLMKIISGQVQA